MRKHSRKTSHRKLIRRSRRKSIRRSRRSGRLMSIQTSTFDLSKYTTLDKDDKGKQQIYLIDVQDDNDDVYTQIAGIFSSLQNAKSGLKEMINNPARIWGKRDHTIQITLIQLSINEVLEEGHINNSKRLFQLYSISIGKLESSENLRNLISDAIDKIPYEKDTYGTVSGNDYYQTINKIKEESDKTVVIEKPKRINKGKGGAILNYV